MFILPSAKSVTFYIVTTLLTTSSYPMLLLDHILCLFNTSNPLSTPIVIHFLVTAHSYGTLILMPSSWLKSLDLSTLPFVATILIFLLELVVVCICLLYLCACTYNLVNCSNFICCTYKGLLCSYIASSVFVLASMYVCVGSTFAGCPFIWPCHFTNLIIIQPSTY